MGYSLEKECKGRAISSDYCHIIPENGTSQVMSYGSVTKGTFKGDPDIAGQGVIVALLFVTCLVVFLGLMLHVSHWFSLWVSRKASKEAGYKGRKTYKMHPFCKKLHGLLDPIILSSCDAQILLIFAYGISFKLSFQCSISAYHYNIVVYIIFANCSTFTLAVIFVRNYFKNFVTAMLRLIAMIIILAVYSHVLQSQSANFAPFEVVPEKGTSDSVLFLPAICLLDTESPASQEYNLSKLTRNFQFLLDIIFAWAVIAQAIPPIRRMIDRRTLDPKAIDMKKARGISLRRALAFVLMKLILCFFPFLYIRLAWSNIMKLRIWVDKSGWMDKAEGNPEFDNLGIGQLAPLVALAAIVVPITDRFSVWLAGRYARNAPAKGTESQDDELQPFTRIVE